MPMHYSSCWQSVALEIFHYFSFSICRPLALWYEGHPISYFRLSFKQSSEAIYIKASVRQCISSFITAVFKHILKKEIPKKWRGFFSSLHYSSNTVCFTNHCRHNICIIHAWVFYVFWVYNWIILSYFWTVGILVHFTRKCNKFKSGLFNI